MEGIVYHGSPCGDLKELTRKVSTHQKACVYATKNAVIALLFMGKGMGDLDTVISYSSNGEVTLVERRPGVLEKLYLKSGYLYELDGANFEHYDYLWEPEVISFSDEPVLRCTKIDNILQQLLLMQEQGKLNIFRYPDRPSFIPLDNSDLIEKYVGFSKMGHSNAISDLLRVYPEFQDRVEEILKAEQGKTK